jgi:hypothetical protein
VDYLRVQEEMMITARKKEPYLGGVYGLKLL